MSNQDPQNGPTEIEQDQAKQGVELHRMRWVLHVSLALAVIAVGTVLIVYL